jgi:hypothetical protein
MQVNILRQAEIHGFKFNPGINEIPDFCYPELLAGGYVEAKEEVKEEKKSVAKKTKK